jgi:hypothetical protein
VSTRFRALAANGALNSIENMEEAVNSGWAVDKVAANVYYSEIPPYA